MDAGRAELDEGGSMAEHYKYIDDRITFYLAFTMCLTLCLYNPIQPYQECHEGNAFFREQVRPSKLKLTGTLKIFLLGAQNHV